jgi:hypothetical protein
VKTDTCNDSCRLSGYTKFDIPRIGDVGIVRGTLYEYSLARRRQVCESLRVEEEGVAAEGAMQCQRLQVRVFSDSEERDRDAL